MSNVLEVLIFVPLAVILWLANTASRRREQARPSAGFAGPAYILLLLVYITMFAGGLMVLAVAITGQGRSSVMPDVASPILLGLGLLVPAIVGGLVLIPPARRLCSRFLNIDPTNIVHAVALSYVALVPVSLLINLGFGLENLAQIASANRDGNPPNMVLSVWVQEVALVVLSSVGVGWLSRRNIPAILQRLGIVLPGKKVLLLALLAGFLAAGAVEAFFSVAVALGYQLDEGVRRLNEAIYGPWARTALGIFTISLAAALGEETLFRGAIQPRFGLWLTSFLFALTHSNYGLSIATVVMLGIGLLLGLIRRRYNTSAAIVTHAAYNAVQSALSLF